MLKSAITVDLPSAVADRSKTAVEWVRSLFGARLDLRSNQEELTISALSLVAGMVEGFAAAGIKDVISFVVDKRVVYLDTREVTDDLELILAAAEQKRILERPFKEMHLVLSHKEAGLHALIDVRIRNRVLLGEEEMHLDLSARLEELQIQAGESADAYRARIEAFMKDQGRTEGYRASLDELTRRIADKLSLTLVGARARVEPAVVQIIRPGAPQLGRFRKLAFGGGVERPHYRPVPTYQRSGAYADPFFYYYYDPYYDFMSWVMLDSMLHQHYWHSPTIQVVDTSGALVGTGAQVDTATGDWAGRDAVTVGSDGVAVDSSIPALDDTRSDWFSSDASSPVDVGGGWSDSSSSDGSSSDSASSCSGGSSDSGGSSCSSGSSCGGSSCGGGGCGGGSSD
jgi:uncharacterized membrane protein YgcG